MLAGKMAPANFTRPKWESGDNHRAASICRPKDSDHFAAGRREKNRGFAMGRSNKNTTGVCTVHLHNYRKSTENDHACQICGAKLKISEVEPHPKQGEWEIHGFSCRNCGPVKSLVVKRLH
jgi:hypothetical protein